MLSKEECALGMVQRPNDAAEKGAHAKLSVEECARDMEHIAIHKTNLLHLVQNSRLLLINPCPITALPELLSEDQKTGRFLEKCPSFVKKL